MIERSCAPHLPLIDEERTPPSRVHACGGQGALHAGTSRRPERRNTPPTREAAGSRAATAAHTGIPRAAQPELPALLVRPGHLVGRELDADYRAILARAPPDQLPARPRHRHHLPDAPRPAARALRRRDRRPRAEAATAPHHADDDAGAGNACLPCSPPGAGSISAYLYAPRRRARHRERAGQPRTPGIRQGTGRRRKMCRTRWRSTRSFSTAPG